MSGVKIFGALFHFFIAHSIFFSDIFHFSLTYSIFPPHAFQFPPLHIPIFFLPNPVLFPSIFKSKLFHLPNFSYSPFFNNLTHLYKPNINAKRKTTYKQIQTFISTPNPSNSPSILHHPLPCLLPNFTRIDRLTFLTAHVNKLSKNFTFYSTSCIVQYRNILQNI